jgi:caffeoyl-CoA O-methyltransferase
MKLSTLYQYADSYTQKESKWLLKLNRETHLKLMNPRMLAGHLQGRLLQMISQMVKPKCILEIGTFTGYSAICMTAGLQKGGKLHTIDIDPELEDMIRRYFKEAGVEEKIDLHIGNALDIIPKLKEEFDLVYIDADKENYVKYYEMVLPKVKAGGFILADNCLWDGKVLEKPDKDDRDTKGIIDFNNHILKDERVENLLLPFRDGVMIMRKK